MGHGDAQGKLLATDKVAAISFIGSLGCQHSGKTHGFRKVA
jgi:hypothetical protein